MTASPTDTSPAATAQTPRAFAAVLTALMVIGLAVTLVATALTPTSANAQGAVAGVGNGRVDWHGWSLGYDNPAPNADLNWDGLAVSSVRFDGLLILQRASLPVMNVYYENDICGPYADRLGGNELGQPAWREFIADGTRWLEIGVEATIGAYVIYQAFYFSENGQMDAHIFSKGLQCNNYHEHYPFIRLDFDIGDAANDQILRSTTAGWAIETFEFDRAATDAVNHGWSVFDKVTGDSVSINFDDGGYQLPGGVVPETNYANNRVYGRTYKPDEVNWGFPINVLAASRTVPWNNGEVIDSVDNVLWYTGFMPHVPEEGPDLWHSTGVRLTINSAGTPVTPTAVPTPGSTCGGRSVTVDLNLRQVPTSGPDVIMGTSGNDQIAGQAGNDIICGGGGNDTIWGQDGDDWIYGQDGDDKIRGGAGDDVLYGGHGSDDINGGRDHDLVFGEGGDDSVLRGGTGDDDVEGGEGNDSLVAGNGGEDTVRGNSGNDKVTGGPRPDKLYGGEGNDELRGGGGADELYGENGDDMLFGAQQPDSLVGGNGIDACNGGITGDGAVESDSHVLCEGLVNFP